MNDMSLCAACVLIAANCLQPTPPQRPEIPQKNKYLLAVSLTLQQMAVNRGQQCKVKVPRNIGTLIMALTPNREARGTKKGFCYSCLFPSTTISYIDFQDFRLRSS